MGSSSSTDTSQGSRITALETAVGSATGDNAGGIAKDVKDVKDAIGTATGDNASGLAKDVADISTAIGDANTEGTILARIKALEDAQTPSEQEPSG